MQRKSPQIWRIGLLKPFRPESMQWRPCAFSTAKDSLMLTSDFKEFAALLNSNKVEYPVVGGIFH